MNKIRYLIENSLRRRLLAAGASLPVLACAGAAGAQVTSRAQKPVRVGILTDLPQFLFKDIEKLFLDRMRELGWVEGRNVTYDQIHAIDNQERLPELAKALVARHPDVIVVRNSQPSLAEAAATRTIPIVFGGVTNPEQRGLVKSLWQPGGNVTGTTPMGGVLGGKRLQLLKEAVPKINKVGVLVNPSYSQTSSEDFRLVEQAAKKLGVTIVAAQVADVNAFDSAFAHFTQQRVEGLLSTQNTFFGKERRRVLEFVAKRRMPLMGPGAGWANEGALMSYGASLLEEMQSTARLVDKILKGAKPADIPVEQSTRFELVLNLKTAKALGITIPQSFVVEV